MQPNPDRVSQILKHKKILVRGSVGWLRFNTGSSQCNHGSSKGIKCLGHATPTDGGNGQRMPSVRFSFSPAS